jgi:hypothetical protein
MTDTITVGLNPTAAAIDERMVRMPSLFVDRVKRAIDRITLEAERTIHDKLNGPVLHWRTGRLWRSIHRSVEVTATSVIGYLFAGLEAPYGRVHEFGWAGVVQVPAHDRRNALHRTTAALVTRIRAGQAYLTNARQKLNVNAQYVHVKAFSYSVVFPERSYMRTTIEDYKMAFFDRMAHAGRGLGGAQLNAST